MKIFKVLFIAILGSACLKATAQHCNMGYLGSKTLYKAPAKTVQKVPEGYRAVFINHVGRHGARHLTKEVSASYTWALLKRADSLHLLTDDGVKLWAMVVKLNKVEHGNVKNISGEGKSELFGLGERLYDNYLEVLQKPIRLNVAITKEVRTKQSADAFLAGLKSKLKDSMAIKTRNDDVALRFYDLSPAYTQFEEKGAWLVPYDSLKRDLKIETLQQKAAARWLKPALLQDLKTEQVDKLISDVFGFENITYSAKEEIALLGYKPEELDISSLFTCEELGDLGRLDAADGYYKKGPGLDNNGIQVKIATPLLADFIRTTDAFIAEHPYTAELRFAHAETISPFAAIMDMEPASMHAKNAMAIAKAWDPAAIICLSANIDWVLYKNANGNYLVKFLLNEKPVKINGLKATSGYYYDWKAARAFYLKKILANGATLNGNMNDYLSALK